MVETKGDLSERAFIRALQPAADKFRLKCYAAGLDPDDVARRVMDGADLVAILKERGVAW